MTADVCEECGSDVIYQRIETTSYVSSSREFEEFPERCSNPACVNFHGGGYTGFTVTRAQWDAAHPER